MNQVVLASLLAAAGAVFVPSVAVAQATPSTPAAGATGASGATGQVQLSQDEYAAYQKGVTATAPADKVAAFEAYLKQYPNSSIKAQALNQILFADTKLGNETQILDAADRLLAVEPNNLRALTFEVYYRKQDADKLTDPTAKQTGLDQAASFAQRGLSATAPTGGDATEFDTLKKRASPTFESAIADDDLAKKDNAGAITALQAELTAAPPAALTTVGPVLQDEYTLANAYYTSTPPDYLNCAYYAARAGQYAPAPVNTQIQQLATYCFTKYHGSADGYPAFQTTAQASLTPPATLSSTVTPAPKPEDLVRQLITSTPDLATLALSDKEFVLQYGETADADKVFDTIKGKTVEIPGAKIVAATADQLQVAVSQDAVQGNTADFTINMKTPLATPPAVGTTVNVSGTYTSYTQKPLMITMSDGAIVAPKKAAPARTPARRH